MYFFLSNWHRNIATTDLVVLARIQLLSCQKQKKRLKKRCFNVQHHGWKYPWINFFNELVNLHWFRLDSVGQRSPLLTRRGATRTGAFPLFNPHHASCQCAGSREEH